VATGALARRTGAKLRHEDATRVIEGQRDNRLWNAHVTPKADGMWGTCQKTVRCPLENDETFFHFRTDDGGWMFA